MTNTTKTVFHRDGRVSMNGKIVGNWHRPDPSGAPWARKPVYVLKTLDGRTEQAPVRSMLADRLTGLVKPTA